MTEDQVKMLIDSYGLSNILENLGVTEEFVLEKLIDLGYVQPEDLKEEYF